MVVVTVKNGQISVPEDLLQQAGLKDGDAVIVEAVASHTFR